MHWDPMMMALRVKTHSKAGTKMHHCSSLQHLKKEKIVSLPLHVHCQVLGPAVSVLRPLFVVNVFRSERQLISVSLKKP